MMFCPTILSMVVLLDPHRYPFCTMLFRVELPPDYNDVDTWPVVMFTSSVFNPMVNPKTGELDLKSVFPEWVPGKHYMVTALTYLKKVFYMKDFSFSNPANPEAQRLFQVSGVNAASR